MRHSKKRSLGHVCIFICRIFSVVFPDSNCTRQIFKLHTVFLIKKERPQPDPRPHANERTRHLIGRQRRRDERQRGEVAALLLPKEQHADQHLLKYVEARTKTRERENERTGVGGGGCGSLGVMWGGMCAGGWMG
jgi:hypothetical protein